MAAKAKIGTGARFSALEQKLGDKPGVKNPAALAAFIGRKKFGDARFQALSANGRKRKKRH